MIEVLIVGAIVVVLIAAIVVFGMRKGTNDVGLALDDELQDGVVSDPVPIERGAPTGNSVEFLENATASGGVRTAIRWTKQFETAGPLSDDARLSLIRDLGMLRAAWCVPLLEQAAAEETDPSSQAAVQRSLSRCRDSRARITT